MTPLITRVRGALVALAAIPAAGAQRIRVIPATDEYAENGGLDKLGFNVMVIAGPTGDGDIAAQAQAELMLDELLDPLGGMRTALEADRTLDGLVGDTTVRKCSGYQIIDGQLGATWHVVCML